MHSKLTGRGSTLSKLTLISALGVALSLAAHQAAAVDVFTDPVGFITLTANGTNTFSPGLSYLGLGMTQLPANRGLVSSVAGTGITVNNTLTANQFKRDGSNNPTAFIEITSGANAGLIDDIVSNSTTTIFTASDDSALVSAGQTYKVYPHWTIDSVFGSKNEAGLLGGNSSSAADNIIVFAALSQSSSIYYFRTNTTGGCPLGGCGWRSTSSTSSNVGPTVLDIDNGVKIQRRQGPDITVKLVGGVKLGQTIIPIATNINIVGNVYPVTNLTLGVSGLYTGSSATGVLGGNSSSAADNVDIWNGTGFDIYYFRTNVTGGCPLGGCGWRSTSSTSIDKSGTSFPLGGSVRIQRRAGGFNWTAPQTFTP